MSNLITEAFVQQYRSNVTFLYQREGSLLRGLVREEPVSAKYHYFERLGETTAVKKTVRHGATPQVNSQHSRRRAEMYDYEWADLIDKQDQVRILIQPISSYAMNAAMAMGRAYDDELISAFDAAAVEGETGSTTTAFPTGTQQIVNGSVGMTVQKLKDAKLLFDNANVPQGDRWLVWSPEASMDLMDDPQVTSSDFNIVQALVTGSLNGPYVGFRYVMHTGLTVASNIRKNFAFHRNTMAMGVGMDFTARIDELPTQSYSTQVYTAGTFGGVRVQDLGVVQIDIDESV